jgi:hypothetical protein
MSRNVLVVQNLFNQTVHPGRDQAWSMFAWDLKKMKGDTPEVPTICVDTILTFVKEQHLPETSTMSETYLTFLKNKHPETSTIV